MATAAGAVVHRSREIRPELGTNPGKGEAMWKSLFVTRGDLLVFMDADLVDWDTHFVPGLLGPLLAEDGVALVKGFDQRPLADDTGHETALEGGRVTELVARPLIALECRQSWLCNRSPASGPHAATCSRSCPSPPGTPSTGRPDRHPPAPAAGAIAQVDDASSPDATPAPGPR